MDVIAWSRSLTNERAKALGIGRKDSLTELAGDADIVSVHLALVPETRGLIGAEFFAAMRPGAYFINTSRGEVVDQNALLAALRDRRIRVGLDVYSDEPKTGLADFNAADCSRNWFIRNSSHRAHRPNRRRRPSPRKRCGSFTASW